MMLNTHATAKSVCPIARVQPEHVDGNFSCDYNQLTSLEDVPKSVGGSFYCNGNRLTSLEGAPKSVGGDFYCHRNQLTSLRDVHKHVKEVGGTFYCNTVKSHVLGLFLVKGLQEVDLNNEPVNVIINKHLPSRGRTSMVVCAEELIEAGFEAYAQV
jgi:hypothetical protein